MNRRLFTIFMIVFVNFLGSTLVLPTLPLYASRHFDASPETISLMLATFFIAQFIAAPILGRLSDRYGRLPVLIISQIGTVISFILMGGAESLAMLFFARALDGITGGNVIVAQAYIADISTRENRTRSLGVVWTAFGVGYILGPALGGIVGGLTNDRMPFYVGAAISLLCVLLTWFTLDESLTPERRALRLAQGKPRIQVADIFGNPVLPIILLIGFMAQIGIALLQSTLALFGEAVVFTGQSEQQVNIGVGLLLTAIGVGQLLMQMVFLPRLINRYGERRMVLFGDVLRAVGFLSMALFTSPWLIGGVSLLTIAMASGMMMPSLQALATTSVREEISGAVLGVYQSAVTIGIIIGTAAGGWLFSASPSLPYVVAGVLLIIALAPISLLVRRAQDACITDAAQLQTAEAA